MDYRYLGRSALKVSPLCLGAMMFGGETDEATSKRIVDKAFDQGVNFIDTADVYHAGRSEEIVGRAIADRRDNWVVATKFGYPTTQGPNEQGQSRKWIIQSVEASLKRLGTDYIDILYFHRALVDAPLEEGVRAIGDLIRQGKIRYFGLSTSVAGALPKSHVSPTRWELTGPSRANRSTTLWTVPRKSSNCRQQRTTVWVSFRTVRSRVASSAANMQWMPHRRPTQRAGRGDKRIQQTEWRPESLRIAQTIADHAAKCGTTSIAFALAWVLKNRIVSSTIAGPRTEAQWDSYVEALKLELGPEDEKLVDNLVAPGHASTPGYTDPGYPVEGRRVG